MKIIDYLDNLNWTQNRLAAEAKVSVSTVQRLVQAKPISRQNADKICDALSQALGYPVKMRDVNEIHVSRAERPERRKQNREAQAQEEILHSNVRRRFSFGRRPDGDNAEGTKQ